MALSLRFGAVSDIGRRRRRNEDSAYAGPHFLAVADGMGGAPAGDLASAITIQTLRRLDGAPPEDLLEALAGAINRANDRLAELIDSDSTVEGMGTTVTAALFDGTHIGVAHLGDSRGYLLRDGNLQRISADHSWVQSMVDEGRITEAEAASHTHRSVLLRVLDGRQDSDPDLTLYEVSAGDRILLCSDGLSGFVEQDRIQRVLSVGEASEAAAELTRLALEHGSTDNVTVVVGDVVEGDAPKAAPIIVGAAAEEHRSALRRLRNWTQREDPGQPGEMLMTDPTADPEELRYAPREPRHHTWIRRGAIIVAVLAVLAAAGVLSYRWTQTQYFVGADGNRVAIYQGVEAELPGMSMHHVYEHQGLRLSQLPSFRRSQVLDGISADSLPQARHIVAQLRSFARICAEQSTNPSTTTLPTQTPATTPGTTATSSASTSPATTTGRRTTTSPTKPGSTRSTGRHTGSRSTGPTTPSVTVTGPFTPPTVSPSRPRLPEECAGATPRGTSR